MLQSTTQGEKYSTCPFGQFDGDFSRERDNQTIGEKRLVGCWSPWLILECFERCVNL